MSDQSRQAAAESGCNHCTFGLIVTGKGEREFLPELFSVLTKWSGCSFKVIRKIDQRGRITNRRRLKMAGSGSPILDKDEQEIGLAARAFLRNQDCRFVIVIDDVESGRREYIAEIWQRYRTALDTMPGGAGVINQPIQIIIEDPVMRNSRESYLIQAADCTSFLLKHSIVVRL